MLDPEDSPRRSAAVSAEGSSVCKRDRAEAESAGVGEELAAVVSGV